MLPVETKQTDRIARLAVNLACWRLLAVAEDYLSQVTLAGERHVSLPVSSALLLHSNHRKYQICWDDQSIAAHLVHNIIGALWRAPARHYG